MFNFMISCRFLNRHKRTIQVLRRRTKIKSIFPKLLIENIWNKASIAMRRSYKQHVYIILLIHLMKSNSGIRSGIICQHITK